MVRLRYFLTVNELFRKTVDIMKVIRFEVGNLGTNCYIAYCEQTRQAAVIDPGGNAAQILDILAGQKLQVKLIINTHGHVDHIAANGEVQNATGAAVLIHPRDAGMLTNPQQNLSSFIGGEVVLKPADRLINDGDIIPVGNTELTVLHTPGHTPGGICLKGDDLLFSGDTLFAESIGRTDFPGGSYQQLITAIQEKLMVLPDGMKVLPGHGPETTIGWERTHNPFIQ
ncbi:metallo-beta-lactamase [Lucifera butyrica]|uniref:Metallo-beta-lactamase n=2 Tax=Lucifera butyrica TaxID=1351585 RepID=A0A498R4H3_9FIRM|nr:metallo-beta-lactamase [Lucifera butyrica]